MENFASCCLVAIVCSALFACTDSADSESETRQDETIEVHGCQPGYIEVGDGEKSDMHRSMARRRLWRGLARR